jgi:hypothetical protein
MLHHQMIDHVKTDTFSIGTFGRAGSRTIADFICGYYREMVWPAYRERYLHDWDSISSGKQADIIQSYDAPNQKYFVNLLKNPQLLHHLYSVEPISNFNIYNTFLNNTGPKILIVRDPIERAKSGQEKKYEPVFHGAPVLRSINLETVDYILPFEKLSDYVLGINIGNPNDIPFLDMQQDWKLEDYNYDEETDTYNDILQNKEVLPIDLWKKLVRTFHEINIPNMNSKIRYKKKWDM